jgi:Homeodomain-like domain
MPRHAGMDRQTLRDWVHRDNAHGLAGLDNRRHAGPKPRLTPEQTAELEALVEQGPDPAQDGVVRWRRVDLQVLIKARFDVQLHARSSCTRARWASCCAGSASPAYRSAPSTPRASPSEPEAQEAFKTLRRLGASSLTRARRRQAGRRQAGRDLVRGWLTAARSTGSASRAP